MQVIRNNKKMMIVKSKDHEKNDCYNIINKTESMLILHDQENNYITIRPRGSYKTKNKEAARYV